MRAKQYTSNKHLISGVEKGITFSTAEKTNEQEMMVFILLQIVYVTAIMSF